MLRKCHYKLTWTWSLILPQVIRTPSTSTLSKLLSHQPLSLYQWKETVKHLPLGPLHQFSKKIAIVHQNFVLHDLFYCKKVVFSTSILPIQFSLRWEFTKQWRNLVLLSPTIQPLISNTKRSITFFIAFPIQSSALLLCSITLRWTFIFLFQVKLKNSDH